MSPTKIAIIGIGKITQDQHLPVIAKDARSSSPVSSASADCSSGRSDLSYAGRLYAALPDLDAVAICTPPSVRHAIAREALDAGKHVVLEKPPAPTMAEMNDLDRMPHGARPGDFRDLAFAIQRRPSTRQRSASPGKKIVSWRSNGRRTCGAGIPARNGFGTPAISACSIPASTPSRSLPRSCPAPVREKAQLRYPENRDTPIAASLVLPARGSASAGSTAEFDWRQKGDQSWNIDIATEDGARAAPHPWRLQIVRRRRLASKRRWPNMKASIAFRRIARQGRQRDGLRALPARRRRVPRRIRRVSRRSTGDAAAAGRVMVRRKGRATRGRSPR